jgi:xanthine/uracil/vitamin C permease (AzgA family)
LENCVSIKWKAVWIVVSTLEKSFLEIVLTASISTGLSVKTYFYSSTELIRLFIRDVSKCMANRDIKPKVMTSMNFL